MKQKRQKRKENHDDETEVLCQICWQTVFIRMKCFLYWPHILSFAFDANDVQIFTLFSVLLSRSTMYSQKSYAMMPLTSLCSHFPFAQCVYVSLLSLIILLFSIDYYIPFSLLTMVIWCGIDDVLLQRYYFIALWIEHYQILQFIDFDAKQHEWKHQLFSGFASVLARLDVLQIMCTIFVVCIFGFLLLCVYPVSYIHFFIYA